VSQELHLLPVVGIYVTLLYSGGDSSRVGKYQNIHERWSIWVTCWCDAKESIQARLVLYKGGWRSEVPLALLARAHWSMTASAFSCRGLSILGQVNAIILNFLYH